MVHVLQTDNADLLIKQFGHITSVVLQTAKKCTKVFLSTCIAVLLLVKPFV